MTALTRFCGLTLHRFDQKHSAKPSEAKRMNAPQASWRQAIGRRWRAKLFDAMKLNTASDHKPHTYASVRSVGSSSEPWQISVVTSTLPAAAYAPAIQQTSKAKPEPSVRMRGTGGNPSSRAA
jgi:hypothetical protein